VDFLAKQYFRKYKIHYAGVAYDPKEIDEEVYQQAMDRGENWANVDPTLMRIYQHSDGQREMLLFRLLYPRILAMPRMYDWYRTEIDTVLVTVRIEDYGIKVDRENTKELNKRLSYEFQELSQEVRKEYGEYYNLSSENQVGHLLYTVLKYPVIGWTRKGNPSASKDTLIMMKNAHPDDKVFDYIMKWRALVNGITLTTKYLRLSEQYSGLIHTTINSRKARTGRQSSENPPLQNITKEINPNNPYPIPLRSCFCARSKRVLWFFDYAGIEMYLIVERSGCQAMRDIIDSGGDTHGVARDIFYGIKGNVITLPSGKTKKLSEKELKEYRIPAKTVHFSIPYGGTDPAKICKALGLSVEQTTINLQKYADRFPEIFHFSHTMMNKAKKNGYIITSHGVRIYVPLDNLHAAADYDIQGTAAEIMKRAEVGVDKYLREELNDEIRIVMTIHDELIFCAPDYPNNEKREIVKRISDIMCDMPAISIPLKVEQKETNGTWSEAKEMVF
jgi:DNA polymerase-1